MPRLAVSSLRLSHFRSHRLTELAFDGRPVAIFGPNGAGKTNVLEALSLLSPGRGLRRAAPDEIARRPEALGWKVRADVESLHQFHEVETLAEAGASRSVVIDGKVAPQASLGRIVRMLWLVPAMDRLWTEGAEGRRRFLDRMTLSFEPAHAEAVLAYEKAMRERNRLLKDEVRDARWFGALELQMAEAGAAIQANRAATVLRVLGAQSGDAATFPRAELSILHPEGDGDAGDAADLAEAFARGRARDMAWREVTGIIPATMGTAMPANSQRSQKS